MSIRTVRVDDLTGEILEEGPPVRFALGGVEYEIDLSPRNRERLNQTLAPYVDAARRASYRAVRLPRTGPRRKG